MISEASKDFDYPSSLLSLCLCLPLCFTLVACYFFVYLCAGARGRFSLSVYSFLSIFPLESCRSYMLLPYVTPQVLNTTGIHTLVLHRRQIYCERRLILTRMFLVNTNHHKWTVQSMLGSSSSSCERS